MRHFFFFLFFLLFSCLSFGQNKVTVSGKVMTSDGTLDFLNLFVVNKSSRVGNFGNPNGSFEIKINPSDTILIGATGYTTAKLFLPENFSGIIYETSITLQELQVKLKEVNVFAKRKLEAIYKDIETLGYNKKDYRLSGVDALSSPITALYMMISRREQRKLKAYELINEQKRRDLLKELFQQFVDYNIIKLDDEEFEDFIDFCDVSDEMLKRSTQYEFIEFIKMKFGIFKEMTRFDSYDRSE